MLQMPFTITQNLAYMQAIFICKITYLQKYYHNKIFLNLN